jgi:hypothetical protein
MGRAVNAFRGQRSVFTTRRHAAYPALTYAFSIGSNRGHRTDDFGSRIIARLAGIEQESAKLRQVVKRVRQAIEQMRTGIATGTNRIRTFLDQSSETTNELCGPPCPGIEPASNRNR